MMRKLGIIQGRLSKPVRNRIQAFPVDSWREEFPLAANLGLDCMEWIYEYETKDENPISSENGAAAIRRLSREHGVRISSLVADCFMTKRPFGNDKREVGEAMRTLDFLIKACAEAGIPLVEIPLVDNAALCTSTDKRQAVENLKEALVRAAKRGVRISLETSLPPREFRELILAFGRARIYVNYDMGNSASLGYDPEEEMTLLGEFIANIHIKDRVRGGMTVPLGEGDTDFGAVFAALRKTGYRGDFVLQAARQDLSSRTRKKDAETTIRGYIDFIKPFMEGLQ